MKIYFLALVSLVFLAEANSQAINEWQILSESADGGFFRDYSVCYDNEYINKKVLPLDGEMQWDAARSENLKSKIEKVGTIDGLQIYDVFQKYNAGDSSYQIKIIAFKNEKEEYCPFYAKHSLLVLPASGETILEEMNSHIVSADGIPLVGHYIRVYRRYEFRYFAFFDQKPVFLNFQGLANKKVKDVSEYLEVREYIRSDKLDVENLQYHVKLKKETDPNCCPSGDDYLISYKIIDGKLKLVGYEKKIEQEDTR